GSRYAKQGLWLVLCFMGLLTWGRTHMKLRAFAQQAGVRYEKAWRWFKTGKIKGCQLGAGTIIVPEELEQHAPPEAVVVVYARVSAKRFWRCKAVASKW